MRRRPRQEIEWYGKEKVYTRIHPFRGRFRKVGVGGTAGQVFVPGGPFHGYQKEVSWTVEWPPKWGEVRRHCYIKPQEAHWTASQVGKYL